MATKTQYEQLNKQKIQDIRKLLEPSWEGYVLDDYFIVSLALGKYHEQLKKESV